MIDQIRQALFRLEDVIGDGGELNDGAHDAWPCRRRCVGASERMIAFKTLESARRHLLDHRLKPVQGQMNGRGRVRGLDSRVRRAAREWRGSPKIVPPRGANGLLVRDDAAKRERPHYGGGPKSLILQVFQARGGPWRGYNSGASILGFCKEKRASMFPASARKLARRPDHPPLFAGDAHALGGHEIERFAGRVVDDPVAEDLAVVVDASARGEGQRRRASRVRGRGRGQGRWFSCPAIPEVDRFWQGKRSPDTLRVSRAVIVARTANRRSNRFVPGRDGNSSAAPPDPAGGASKRLTGARRGVKRPSRGPYEREFRASAIWGGG